jgi:putative transposase
MLKVWTGSCWSWLKLHTLGRDLPDGDLMGSPQLVRKGERWWLHTPLEKPFQAPAKVIEQLTAAETRICAVDLNLDHHLAVCSVQSARGTRLSTSFIGNGTAVAGTRRATAWTYCTQPISDWHPCRERTGQCRPLGQNQAR